VEHDRRLYQRLHLTRPIEGRFGRTRVRIIDVSATGALIEHDSRVPAKSKRTLTFPWRGEEVKVKAQVVRSSESESGLKLEENETLNRLIAQSAEEILRAQQANMDGDRDANVIGDQTLTSASAGLGNSGYVVWSLAPDGWKKRRALLPDQPENGFTISASEPVDQVELLKQTWETGNEESRRMTRMLAELSAASVRSKD
jgi:hypothetical protein